MISYAGWYKMAYIQVMHEEALSYFSSTNFRKRNRLFGIRLGDRLSHTYLIGETSVSKCRLNEILARRNLETERPAYALCECPDPLAKA